MGSAQQEVGYSGLFKKHMLWNLKYSSQDFQHTSTSGGSRGGARGAPAPAEIWLAPEVPLSCHSSGIYVSVKSFEIQPVQRKLYM